MSGLAGSGGMGEAEHYYDRYWTEGVGGWRVVGTLSPGMRDLLVREVSGRAVVDFGGGDGERYGALIRQHASRYAVADVSPAVLEARAAKGDIPIPVDTLTKHGDEFDVGIMLEVAEHLLDPVEGLSSLAAAVRPGGRIIVTVPNAFSTTNRVRVLFGRAQSSGVGAPGLQGRTYLAPHIRMFDARALRLLAEDVGLSEIAVRGDGKDYGPRLHRATADLHPQARAWFTHTLVLTATVV